MDILITLIALSLLLLFVLFRWAYLNAGEADWGGITMKVIAGLNRLWCLRWHRLEYSPPDLPQYGPALVVANHISGLDSLVMIAASPRPLRFIIAREEFQRFGLNWLYKAVGCIPVDRDSRPQEALRAALSALNQGEVVALFPHGRIHLETDPPRKLKRGVLWLAQQTGCPIIPQRITGVRRAGHVFSPVFLRGRVQMKTFPPYPYADCANDEQCLQQLSDLLEGRDS